MFDQRLITNLDWLLFFVVLILATLGVVNLYSATFFLKEVPTPLYLRQIYWFLLGFLAMLIVFSIDYRNLIKIAYPLHLFSLILLFLVLLFGQHSTGIQRWFRVGTFSFQPSELAKITFILALTKYLGEEAPPQGYTLKELKIPLLGLLFSVLLIIKQPDLGTALLFILIFFPFLFLAGLKPSSFWTLFLAGIASSPLFWHYLKDYQKRRLLSFIYPDLDPLGSGYHLIQSKIAIGSGGFLGKGILKGTQSQLRFLPEQHTDFVFSAWGEEWGFLGSFFLLFLFFLLISQGLNIAYQSKDREGNFIALGITAMLFWQVVINIGMAIGIMPVVGIPLPLMSYGGSSLVTVMIGIGLLENVWARRHMF